MKTIYFISGLGADERVFQYLHLRQVKRKYIQWVAPGRNESLSDYCRRLTQQIDAADDAILVGVSFGGIVAQEIARIINVSKVIIISSVKAANEFGWQLACVRFFRLHTLVPSRILKWSNRLTGDYYFGTESQSESDLLKLIIRDTDRTFMKWAITAIMQWDNDPSQQEIIHIHGDRDRIFPITTISNARIIQGGGHFMIVNRAKAIEAIIANEIGQ